ARARTRTARPRAGSRLRAEARRRRVRRGAPRRAARPPRGRPGVGLRLPLPDPPGRPRRGLRVAATAQARKQARSVVSGEQRKPAQRVTGRARGLTKALAALADVDPEVRREAISRLRWIGTAEAVNGLCAAMEDPVARVRSAAALALGGL